jgi:hypothetical protein
MGRLRGLPIVFSRPRIFATSYFCRARRLTVKHHDLSPRKFGHDAKAKIQSMMRFTNGIKERTHHQPL